MKLLLRWVINAATLLLISQIFSEIFVAGWYTAFITALILGLVNAVIRPILVFLTFPITVLTLGLFTFVINALLFWFVSTFVDGFIVADFGAAFWGALIMSVVSWLVSTIIHSKSV